MSCQTGNSRPRQVDPQASASLRPGREHDSSDALDDDGGRQVKVSDETTARLQEERRLMYVGITRAQRTLAVSWTKKRKKGREMVAAQPSRFIAEMALSATTAREDPREKLKALREEFARKVAAAHGATN